MRQGHCCLWTENSRQIVSKVFPGDWPEVPQCPLFVSHCTWRGNRRQLRCLHSLDIFSAARALVRKRCAPERHRVLYVNKTIKKWIDNLINNGIDIFLTLYLCVCDYFLHQGQQLVGEEGCSGLNKSNSLGLVDVCNNLSPETQTLTLLAPPETCVITKGTVKSVSHLKLVHRLFGFKPSQYLILA